MSELSESSVFFDRSMSPYAESLLAHAGWVQKLARSLVGDQNLADDLVQETWVMALQRPPSRGGNLREWLSTVLRNLARQRNRADTRRQRHETQAVPRGSAPPAGDLVEQVATQKRIVEAVLELDEPYRTAVLMRYYEDIPPRKIAAQLGVPVSTLHTRITRGLEKLRARLDAQHGSRRTWMLALIPSIHSAQAGPLLGAAIMKSKLNLAIPGVLALIVGTAVIWPLATSDDDGGEENTAPAAQLVATKKTEQPDETAPIREGRRKVVAPPTVAVEKKQPADRVLTMRVRGRLVNAKAVPLVGKRIGFFKVKGFRAKSDAVADALVQTTYQGAFEVEVEATSGQFRITEAGWRTVLQAVISDNPPADNLVVAAPEIPLAGRVVDEFGRDLAGVDMKIVLPKDFRTRFAGISDSAADAFDTHKSGEDGRFAIEDACFIDGAHLRVRHPEFAELDVPLMPTGDAGLVVRMRRLTRADGAISGQVLSQHGQIVAGAWVTLGFTTTKSDDQGNFTVKIPERGPTNSLYAIKMGYLPGHLRKPDDQDDWPGGVVLRLGGEPLSISGRVVDADGKPVAAVKVWVYDGSFAGRVDNTTSTVQGLILGAMTRTGLMERIRSNPSADPRELMRNTSTAMWPFVRTDADGSFEIVGLVARKYVLRAMLEDTLLIVSSAPIAAGSTDALLTFPADAYYKKLRGRLVSKSGRPIANASIATVCDPASIAIGDFGRSTQHASAQRTRTDKDGRFEFERVPKNLVYIRADHDDIVPIEYGRSTEGGLATLVGTAADNLTIVVTARAHFNVVLSDPTTADSFAIFDAEGRILPFNEFTGRGRRTLRNQPLHSGKSGTVVAPETATKIVLFKGGEKVDEWDITLVVGQVNNLRR